MNKSVKLCLAGLVTGVSSLTYVVVVSEGQPDLVSAVGTMASIALIFLAGQERLPQENKNS